MLAKILGWFWLIMGIIFLLKPEFLRKRLQKKSLKKLKKIFFSIALLFGGLILATAFRTHGFLSKFLMVLGILSVFKAFFLLKSKIAEKIIEWLANQPITLFRIGASIHILIAVIILAFSKS